MTVTEKEEIRMVMQLIEGDCYVDATKEIEHPLPALSFGNKTYFSKAGNKTFPIPLGSYGNFIFVQAPPKTKKTFFISLLASVYLYNDKNATGELKGHRTDNQHLVHFDTEQGRFHCQRVFRRPIEMTGVTPENYHTLALRHLSFRDRVDFIEYYLYDKLDEANIGLVIIDGIADLCADVNNIEEANIVVQKLMKWSSELNCLIITVIHSNFGSDKPTGHLGSFLEKKAETQIQLEANPVNKELVSVKCKRSRNTSFEDFSFRVNEYGLPVLEGDFYDILQGTNF